MKPTPTLAALLAAALLSGCASAPAPPTSAADVPELAPGSGYLIGYLASAERPRSESFLPPAPAAGSATHAADTAAARAAFALRGSPRWQLAAADAQLDFPALLTPFSCALGFVPSEAETPHLAMLLRRAMLDAALATSGAKQRHARERPFVALKEASCTPGEEKMLARDGSYPSGHAAAGWTAALLLAELAPPARREAILARGLAYGQSRVACGVHWPSDVEAGRVVGAATLSALRNKPVFTAQAELARAEIAAQLAQPSAPPAHCAAEAAALAGN